eukprot:TRINITY_DN3267_c0_g1_i1.p1 TRINITY_DN3267_c0_g1~~TRINITY_DN3267_c0_g1_i1.p1  ORF type:complete len:410 (-),score=156.31 TRINITY_DN3267_c0_g1_i1:193-1377(-)
MDDPVITKYGHSFEKSSILKWLKENQSCPMTQKPLTEGDLIPNFSLRDAIEEFRKEIKNNANVGYGDGNGKGLLEQLEAAKKDMVMISSKLQHFKKRHNELIAADSEAEETRKTLLAELDGKVDEMAALDKQLAELEPTEDGAGSSSTDGFEEEMAELQKTRMMVEEARFALEEELKWTGSQTDKRDIERRAVSKNLDSCQNQFDQMQKEYENLYVDVQEKFSRIHDIEADPGEAERMIKFDAALEIKEKGNSCFSKGEFEEAVELYTQAIEKYEPFVNGFFFLNRAAALTKIGQLGKAKDDCFNVLLLFHWDPTSLKPFQGSSESSSSDSGRLSDLGTEVRTEEDKNMLGKTLRRLAEVYKQQGNKKNALASLMRALDINEDDKRAQGMLKNL